MENAKYLYKNNIMEVRITYRSEIYIKGDTLEEIKRKWENIDLSPIDCQEPDTPDHAFLETVSIEDADTFKSLENEWNKT